MFYFVFAFLLVYVVFTFLFTVSSFQERKFRAGGMGLVLSLMLAAVLAAYTCTWWVGLLDSGWAYYAQFVVGAIMVLLTLAFFLPLGRRPHALSGTTGMREGDQERFDQKETIFNIAHVGGFGSEVSKQRWALQSRDPFHGIYWTLVMGLRARVDGKATPNGTENLSPKEATKEIKRVARYLGADLVGVTTVKEDFTYSDGFSYEESKLEVGPAVTTPVELKHKYAIVLAKEMNFSKIQSTLTDKNAESLGEIGKTYFDLGHIACGLAAYIRSLGWSARAHHVRSEQIFQVPHAVDAGLGEQGRMNYLITMKYGPRVRLASVTTDMELIEDRPVDIGVQDFCESCRLCEINCPAQALSGERAVVRGYRRWPQDAEECFKFWVSGGNTFGCTMCLKVCPWNKPRAFVHRVAFFAASRSIIARRSLYWITVIFYGKKIRWKQLPLPEKMELPPEIKALVEQSGSH